MAGKELRRDIVVGGRADSSLFQLGNTIENLGNRVNQISRQLIDFGKESVDTFVNYEDAMLEAQAALSTHYTSTTDLDKAMQALGKSSMQWASETRFTTQDVGNAIATAAHAGWDLEKIMEGMPGAMRISLAGGMDLAEGLEYIVDITNAAGLEFEDLSTFIDEWAYAANSSSTTIPQMGDAMQKMGASMGFFKGEMDDIVTMLAVLADNGTKGSEAGTLLRNNIIRMIAPTKKAAEAMEELNLTSEELDDIYSENEGMEEAARMLEEAGFSAYDSTGKLKPFLQIYEELAAVTDSMTEEDRNTVLSAIFPTRTMSGALALLEAARNGWDGLNEAVNNRSAGYSGNVMEIMESGLGGTLRHLNSVLDTLKTNIGGTLKDDVTWVAEGLTGMIDSINGMNPEHMGALVGGLEVLAGAGPALLVFGGALKFIATQNPVTVTAELLIAAVALNKAYEEYNEVLQSEQYGDLSIDSSALTEYLTGIRNEFDQTRENVELYNNALETAVEDYTNAGTALGGSLITMLATGATLSEADVKNLNSLGTQMQTAIIDGINASYSGAEEILGMYAGADPEALIDGDGGIWSNIMHTLNYGYDNAIAQAQTNSENLRKAMTEAFADGQLTGEEVSNIQSIMQQMNSLLAAQTEAHTQVEMEKLQRQAQTISRDSLQEYNEQMFSTMNEMVAAQEEEYWKVREGILTGGKQKIASNFYDENNNKYTQHDLDMELAAWDKLWQENVNRNIRLPFLSQMLEFNMSSFGSSGLGGIYNDLYDLAGQYLSGDISFDAAHKQIKNEYGANKYAGETLLPWSDQRSTQMATDLNHLISALGGYDAVAKLADDYAAMGDSYMTDQFQRLYMMGRILNNNHTMDQVNGQAGYVQYLDKYAGQTETEGMLEHWQNMVVDVEGNTDPLTESIGAVDGTDISVHVGGDTSSLESAINAYNGRSITVNVHGKSFSQAAMYAEGGRADEASIFGEAGPEWAIPERHDSRTAELLIKSAAASGFTWGELLSRSGGLNAGSGGNRTLVYSPTIYANDATGVESKLRSDKKNLEKWYRDREMIDRVEAYA